MTNFISDNMKQTSFMTSQCEGSGKNNICLINLKKPPQHNLPAQKVNNGNKRLVTELKAVQAHQCPFFTVLHVQDANSYKTQ